MDAQQFAYWLRGFAELSGARPTVEQWQLVKEYLAGVFNQSNSENLSPPTDK
jgi:hypothetical protein